MGLSVRTTASIQTFLPMALARSFLLLLLTLVSGALAAWLHPRAVPFSEATLVGPGEVRLSELMAGSGAILWIDARSREAWEESRIPGALPLSEDAWEDQLPAVMEAWFSRPESVLVVYCDSRACASSHQVAERLRAELGEPEVLVLHNGWEAWLEWLKRSGRGQP